MKTFVSKFAGLAVALGVGVASIAVAYAASGYPINKPKEIEWSFAGPFGTWDYPQLQRGWEIYANNCANCHSIDLIAFRNLQEIGFSENRVKAIAAEYDVEDGPNADGEMFDRSAKPVDRIPGPFENAEEAASTHGIVPPDFSLLAKARAPERGFPTFIFDIFTLYAENGPDYIYSLLTGYKDHTDAPANYELTEDDNYNPYFISGPSIAMSPPLSEDNIWEYEDDDSVEPSLDQNAKDISAFMMWAAEPKLVERKQLGFKVIIFLLIFSVLLYLTKKQVFLALKPKK